MALSESQFLSSLSSIEQLVSTLGDQLDLTGEQIADVLWLTLEIQKFEVSSAKKKSNFQNSDNDGLAENSNQQVEVNPAKKKSNFQNSDSDGLAENSNQQVGKAQESQVINLNKRKPSEKKGSVYANSGSGGSQGLSIGVPDAPSLREPLKLAQALRPLIRQVPTGKRLVLDEAATVQRIAEERIFMPVLKAEPELWLDLALVIDESHSMLIWGHTIQELKEIFKKYGIFRDIRIWGLQPDDTGNSLQIFSRMGSSKRLTDPKEIVDPTGRRLVLIISDCVSNIWRKGMMFPVLKLWTEKQPLTILQMLPEWMWRRTALDLGTAVGFKSSIMGVANQQLSLHKPLRRSRSIGFKVEDRSKIPVITLEWDKAAQWSQMLIGKADALVPGYLLPPELEIEEDTSSSFLEKEDDTVSDLDAEEIVNRFRMTTSPLGRELACLLAASPVINLPVVRLIQESLLPKSNQVQVAEVFLGGLLRPQSVSLEKLQSQESESNMILNSDSVEYEFIQAEIRDIFLDDAPISDSIDVVNAVSRYVEEQLGVSLTNFMAVLAPQQADIIKPFARITARVLRKLGGQYIQFADEIERKINPETVTDFPNKNDIDYTTLENLLKIGEWEKADQETNTLVLKIASKEEEAHLDTISITQLPCENLKTIDQLWIKYSDGHFGFSIQNKIYRTVGGSVKFDKLTWEQFADLVGWHRSGKWLDKVYSLDAPLGHLPFLQIRRTPEDDVNFFSRIANCNLSNDILGTSTLANYTQLQKLLEQGEWKEADIETATIMFKIAGRLEEGWLRPEDIDNFPIFDLLKIDQLWVRYSNSHFGFSIQKQIYQSLGGTKEYNQKITQELWRRLGLIVNNQPHRSQYNNLTFNLSAPKGHLPIKYDIETPSGVHGVIESLFSRQDLGLPDKLIKDNANKLDELISEKFVSQPYKLHLEKYSKPEDYEIENIQDVILAEAEEIKVRIIDYTLENIEENTVILSLKIDIEFSIEIRYDDWDSYIPELNTSDVPFFEHIFSNQRVQGKAEVELSVSEDFTASEIESIMLYIDEPIEVNDDSPTELTQTLDGSDNEQVSNLYALLIGVDCYMPNSLPDGSYYKNLGGCVRDINHVEAFLKDFQKVPENQIIKLTSSPSVEVDKKPLELPQKLPTRQNMIDAFRKLGEIAPANSLVYVHYSGHGGRAKTVFPNIKGSSEIDEGLVPTDIGTSEGQYLRDLELAQLLKELADKKLVVTLVLDCCHSGGATRGEAEVRGMGVEDNKPLQASFQPVAEPEVLAALWQSLTGGGTRGLKAGGVPESSDYVLLAACRQNECAFEFPFNRETKEKNGALTYWLLDTLKQPYSGQTYKDLFDRVNAKINSQFPTQTPVLLGEGNRKIFGTNLGETVFAVPVMKVESNEKSELQAMLAVGQANGVSKGAEFAIYPRGTTDLTKKEDRIAIATIIQRGGSQSLCKLEPISGKDRQVEQGDWAVQISACINLVRMVSLIPKDDPALLAIANALSGNGWVELSEDGAGIDFIVSINDKGEYEIRDSGDQLFKNINPPAKIQDPNAPAKVVKRLVHLARYKATLEIDNTDTDSPLSGKLAVEWLGTSDTYDTGDPIPKKEKLTKFADPTKPTVKVGKYVFLSIRNYSEQTLNVAVLNLDAEWAIEQILPNNESFITLEPGREKIIPLSPSLDSKDDSVENTVKVFGTLDAANYRVLELPSLDERLQFDRGAKTRSFNNPLADLLGAIDQEQPQTRKLTVGASPSTEWTTKQVVLTITK